MYRVLNVSIYYYPRMRVGNVFSHVCLSVQAITFEPLNIETSFLVCRYILTISRSNLSVKVIWSMSYEKKMIILLISTCQSLYVATCH